VEDIREVLKTLNSCQIKPIKREANFDAHGLAKVEVNQIMDRVWIEEIPYCIGDVVFLEQ
jgi:hypothetical protein